MLFWVQGGRKQITHKTSIRTQIIIVIILAGAKKTRKLFGVNGIRGCLLYITMVVFLNVSDSIEPKAPISKKSAIG